MLPTFASLGLGTAYEEEDEDDEESRTIASWASLREWSESRARLLRADDDDARISASLHEWSASTSRVSPTKSMAEDIGAFTSMSDDMHMIGFSYFDKSKEWSNAFAGYREAGELLLANPSFRAWDSGLRPTFHMLDTILPSIKAFNDQFEKELNEAGFGKVELPIMVWETTDNVGKEVTKASVKAYIDQNLRGQFYKDDLLMLFKLLGDPNLGPGERPQILFKEHARNLKYFIENVTGEEPFAPKKVVETLEGSYSSDREESIFHRKLEQKKEEISAVKAREPEPRAAPGAPRDVIADPDRATLVDTYADHARLCFELTGDPTQNIAADMSNRIGMRPMECTNFLSANGFNYMQFIAYARAKKNLKTDAQSCPLFMKTSTWENKDVNVLIQQYNNAPPDGKEYMINILRYFSTEICDSVVHGESIGFDGTTIFNVNIRDMNVSAFVKEVPKLRAAIKEDDQKKADSFGYTEIADFKQAWKWLWQLPVIYVDYDADGKVPEIASSSSDQVVKAVRLPDVFDRNDQSWAHILRGFHDGAKKREKEREEAQKEAQKIQWRSARGPAVAKPAKEPKQPKQPKQPSLGPFLTKLKQSTIMPYAIKLAGERRGDVEPREAYNEMLAETDYEKVKEFHDAVLKRKAEEDKMDQQLRTNMAVAKLLLDAKSNEEKSVGTVKVKVIDFKPFFESNPNAKAQSVFDQIIEIFKGRMSEVKALKEQGRQETEKTLMAAVLLMEADPNLELEAAIKQLIDAQEETTPEKKRWLASEYGFKETDYQFVESVAKSLQANGVPDPFAVAVQVLKDRNQQKEEEHLKKAQNVIGTPLSPGDAQQYKIMLKKKNPKLSEDDLKKMMEEAVKTSRHIWLSYDQILLAYTQVLEYVKNDTDYNDAINVELLKSAGGRGGMDDDVDNINQTYVMFYAIQKRKALHAASMKQEARDRKNQAAIADMRLQFQSDYLRFAEVETQFAKLHEEIKAHPDGSWGKAIPEEDKDLMMFETFCGVYASLQLIEDEEDVLGGGDAVPMDTETAKEAYEALAIPTLTESPSTLKPQSHYNDLCYRYLEMDLDLDYFVLLDMQAKWEAVQKATDLEDDEYDIPDAEKFDLQFDYYMQLLANYEGYETPDKLLGAIVDSEKKDIPWFLYRIYCHDNPIGETLQANHPIMVLKKHAKALVKLRYPDDDELKEEGTVFVKQVNQTALCDLERHMWLQTMDKVPDSNLSQFERRRLELLKDFPEDMGDDEEQGRTGAGDYIRMQMDSMPSEDKRLAVPTRGKDPWAIMVEKSLAKRYYDYHGARLAREDVAILEDGVNISDMEDKLDDLYLRLDPWWQTYGDSVSTYTEFDIQRAGITLQSRKIFLDMWTTDQMSEFRDSEVDYTNTYGAGSGVLVVPFEPDQRISDMLSNAAMRDISKDEKEIYSKEALLEIAKKVQCTLQEIFKQEEFEITQQLEELKRERWNAQFNDEQQAEFDAYQEKLSPPAIKECQAWSLKPGHTNTLYGRVYLVDKAKSLFQKQAEVQTAAATAAAKFKRDPTRAEGLLRRILDLAVVAFSSYAVRGILLQMVDLEDTDISSIHDHFSKEVDKYGRMNTAAITEMAAEYSQKEKWNKMEAAATQSIPKPSAAELAMNASVNRLLAEMKSGQ